MMPRQWKLITLYMVIAYLVFIAAINIAKHQVIDDEKNGTSAAAPSGDVRP